MSYILSLLLFFILNISYAQMTKQEEDIWKKALLYFSLRENKSLVRKESLFFLSSKGYENPELELEKSLVAFKKDQTSQKEFSLFGIEAKIALSLFFGY